MKVVICGVGNEKGFFSACKGVENRHRVYGVDSVELTDIKYQELVKDAPNCYYKKVELTNGLHVLWEIGHIKPDMIVDCTTDPKQAETIKKVCEQKHWDYQRV